MKVLLQLLVRVLLLLVICVFLYNIIDDKGVYLVITCIIGFILGFTIETD